MAAVEGCLSLVSLELHQLTGVEGGHFVQKCRNVEESWMVWRRLRCLDTSNDSGQLDERQLAMLKTRAASSRYGLH